MIKNVSKDTRYIIKRIIIGVGIAIILGLLKTNNVFADSPTDYYLIRQTDSIHSDLIYTSMPSDYSTYLDFSLPYNNNINLNIVDSSYWLSDSNSYYIVFYNQSLNVYYYFFIIDFGAYNNFDLSKMKIQYDSVNNNYLYYFYNNNDDEYQYISGLNRSFFVSNGLVDLSNYTSSPELSSYNFTSDYYIYNNSPLTNLGSGYSLYAGLNENLLNDFTIYDTNLSSLYINDVEQDLPVAPSGYTEIQINGEQAVYFVPKNYETISKVQIDDIDFINFPFYYKGNLKTGFFNLKDNSQIVFNYITPLASESQYSSFDIDFPLYYNSKTTDLCSIIFFNNNSVNSSIYYDSTLFDAYVIDNMGSYNSNISIIDENGDSQDLDIRFNKTIQDQWENGFIIGGDDFLSYFNQDTLYKFFDLIKLPFSFINDLKDSTCSPIILPVPFTNSNITLNCLSTTFSSVLGSHYSTLKMLISGIVLYYTFLLNFYCILDVLKPKTSFEVVDL